MDNEIAIKVEGISKVYRLYDRTIDRLKESLNPFKKKYHHDFFALKDVSFQVKRGETVGIIGKNGSGKSTLLKIITGVLTPTLGTVQVNGRISALLELGAGFNPEYTGIENIFLQGSIMGYSRFEMEQKLDDILAFADIGEFIHQPVKSYSSGMFVRLAFAVATIVDPDILIVDEALAVGDVFFRQKCFNRMEELRQNNTSIILVTHAMNEIRQFCSNALFLDHGQTFFWGNADEAVQRYYFLDEQKKESSLNEIKIIDKAQFKKEKKINSKADDRFACHIPEEAFFDLSAGQEAVLNGAKCISVALCNMQGEPCRMFTQGETGVFYYEFELLKDIDVPIGGILLFNEKNILVHGKNSMQYDIESPHALEKGKRVHFRQEIKFLLASGDYTFSVGLGSVKEDVFLARRQLHYAIIEQNKENLCYGGNVGTFSVGICLGNGITELTHHGICDLPGNVKLEIVDKNSYMR